MGALTLKQYKDHLEQRDRRLRKHSSKKVRKLYKKARKVSDQYWSDNELWAVVAEHPEWDTTRLSMQYLTFELLAEKEDLVVPQVSRHSIEGAFSLQWSLES